MLKTTTGIFLLLLFGSACCLGQSYQKTRSGIKTEINGTQVEVTFYSPAIIRVTKSPVGHNFKKESLSVIKKPGDVKLAVNQNNNIITLTSAKLSAIIALRTGKISYKSVGGGLFSEQDNGTQFTPVDDAGKQTYQVKQSFVLDTADVLYGLGQQQNGTLSQRGRKIILDQGNTRVCIPYVLSIKGYGIFWDNYSTTTYNDNNTATSFESARGDCIDYYVMYGGNSDGVVAQMRDLTGQAPMKPLWAYGFIQSRERYQTQFELLNVVKKYRELGIPLDGIVQDWQYWGADSVWNAQSFDPKTYPRPKAMIDSVHQLNAHLFIVSWPGFGPKTKQFKEFKDKNMQIDFDTWPPKAGARVYDVYNPKARDIFWNHLNKGVFSLGPDAWWLDSTEPDHLNVKEQDWDQPTYLGTYRNVHNAFPLMHSKGVYEHQRAASDQKRVILLTRSAFAGQQRYGSDTWSGDLTSSWTSLKNQIPASLNFSLTGLPYWNVDIGGFFAGDFIKGGGARNPEFQELYVRWLQFCTFIPMMRSHGTQIPREIYQFGNRGDWAFDVQEKFINLRYHLLPYTYATGWDVSAKAGSILRPLFADFPKDSQVYQLNSEFMYGKSFLVIPVTDKGKTMQQVYLPKGATWFDFWTGKSVKGGVTIDKDVPMEVMPLYVKAGSIIPWGPKVQYATEKKWDNLEIRIYPGSNGHFTLHEDENDNYNYEKGKYTGIDFSWDDRKHQLTIGNRTGGFDGMLKQRKFKLTLVNPKAGYGPDETTSVDRLVSYNGKLITVKL